MPGEIFPDVTPAEVVESEAQQAQIARVREQMAQYGGEEAVRARIGLGAEELAQHVQYASYEGTLWEAVEGSFKQPARDGQDERKPCPVGDNLQEAFATGQLEAVFQKLDAFRSLDARFNVTVSPKTRALFAEPEARVNTIQPTEKPPTDQTQKPISKSAEPHSRHRNTESEVGSAGPELLIDAGSNTIPTEILQRLQTAEPEVQATELEPTETETTDEPATSESEQAEKPTTLEIKITRIDGEPDGDVPVPIYDRSQPENDEHRETSDKIDNFPAHGDMSENLDFDAVIPEDEDLALQEDSAVEVTTEDATTENEETTLPEMELAGDLGEMEARSIITSEIVEALAHNELQAVQLETFLTALPEAIQERLVGFLQAAETEPETAETVQALVLVIAQAAERLHDLAMSNDFMSEEAVQIELLVSEWYEELHVQLGLECDEAMILRFLELVRSENYQTTLVKEPVQPDKGTHEHKSGIFLLPQNLSAIGQELRHMIGRYAVGLAI